MKKIIIALSLVPMIAFAIKDAQKDAFNKANIEALKKKGLPVPETGVQLISQENMNFKDWQREKFSEERQELKSKGYISKNSDRAYELMHIQAKIKKMKPFETKMFKGNETHMRKKAEDIPFAYTFLGVPKQEMSEFYGIAPAGTYVKTPQSGWTGAVEFFKTTFAHCAYTENNMLAAHGAAQVAEEEAQDDVNGKVTLIDVEGNKSSGFLYRVNWFDNNFNRNLECATKEFSNDIRNQTIELAKKIDSLNIS